MGVFRQNARAVNSEFNTKRQHRKNYFRQA
jgi:hypothetical protein